MSLACQPLQHDEVSKVDSDRSEGGGGMAQCLPLKEALEPVTVPVRDRACSAPWAKTASGSIGHLQKELS